MLGLVPVVHSAGPDVSRSAAGRAGGEALWLPTALLPRFGTTWHVDDPAHLRVALRVGDVEITSRMTLDQHGRPLAVTFDRWGDPDQTGTSALHPFGMEVDGYTTFGDLTIPSEGRAGFNPIVSHVTSFRVEMQHLSLKPGTTVASLRRH